MTGIWKFCANAQSATSTIPRKSRWQRTLPMRARWNAWRASQAGIKLMVNYWNAWVAASHDLFHAVKSGQVGTVQKIIVQYGHRGPKEIGISQYFADWLYDPVKNGGGAIMDFGCSGA